MRVADLLRRKKNDVVTIEPESSVATAARLLMGHGIGGLPVVAGDGRLAGFLVSFQDEREGRFWPLYQGKNVVGRAETGQKVDVEIGHGTTSTVHATVECDNARFTLQDMGSTNGTYYNEEAIGYQGRREVRDGDRIRFGGYTVLVLNFAGKF